MHLPLLIKWIVIWFSIAAPIGPVGILCIRRTLKRGRLSGFVSGLGTATMDATYALIAIFGIALIWDFLLQYKDLLKMFAVVFLIFLWHRILFEHKSPIKNKNIWKRGLLSDFLSTAIITMSNPMTIFALAAIFTSIDINNEITQTTSCMQIILGVFLWSASRRFILSRWVEFIGEKVDHTIIEKINRIAGICLIGFGILLLISLFLGK